MIITILGSTGSIGTQALDVVRILNKDMRKKIKIKALATFHNIKLLREQILEFKPEFACVFDYSSYCQINNDSDINEITKVVYGLDGLLMIARLNVDIVLNAISGFDGLLPTIECIRAKNNIALANKESLVIAGKIIMQEAKKNNVKIIPVDSEHSSIFRMLEGFDKKNIAKIYLTASGGPFNNRNDLDDLDKIKPAEALKHPTWKMGKKISIDSATLINKGFEIIEAFWLFGVKLNGIDVIVQPESLIHSMIEFSDGSIVAHISPNDMRIPIQYAFLYPEKINNSFSKINFDLINNITFNKVNTMLIGIELCKTALKIGGTMPAVLCIANDIAVKYFLDNKLLFGDIYRFIKFSMAECKVITNYNVSDILSIQNEVRDLMDKFLYKYKEV